MRDIWKIGCSTVSLLAASFSSAAAADVKQLCTYADAQKSFVGVCDVSVKFETGISDITISSPQVDARVRILHDQRKATINGKPGVALTLGQAKGCYYSPSELFALCLTEIIRRSETAQRIESPTAEASGPNYVGRWYVAEPSVCKGRPGETEGLIVYEKNKLFGLENSCRIARVNQKGNAFDLTLRCSGEGSTYTERERLEVRGNQLRRTVKVEGKQMTFTYDRCP